MLAKACISVLFFGLAINAHADITMGLNGNHNEAAMKAVNEIITQNMSSITRYEYTTGGSWGNYCIEILPDASPDAENAIMDQLKMVKGSMDVVSENCETQAPFDVISILKCDVSTVPGVDSYKLGLDKNSQRYVLQPYKNNVQVYGQDLPFTDVQFEPYGPTNMPVMVGHLANGKQVAFKGLTEGKIVDPTTPSGANDISLQNCQYQ